MNCHFLPLDFSPARSLMQASPWRVELTIAVGAAILIYRRVRITVWQKDLDSPFTFEFTLDGKTTRRKTKTKSLHTVARYARTRVDHELRRRRLNQPRR
jgi:hypothetical protein